ncbi:MAG: AAA-like domain-containing protein, partial [Clostridium sp.]|nr:AAA-like domain-containing protein [Clostridium sp.]
MKRFKTTGLCNPKKQYMVDIKDKLEKVKALIENEEYFIINRPRQYGKSTLLFALKKELSKRYVVISISFEGIGDESFKNAEVFSDIFIELILKSLNNTNKEEKEKFKSLLQKKICNFVELSKIITEFIASLNKEVILIIDEVDKSSNNQVFLNFLGM